MMKRTLGALVLLVSLVVGCQTVRAAGQQSQPETFTIAPELPKNNVGGQGLGYFNLKFPAGKTRTVRINLMNPTDKTITIHGNVVDARTTDEGTVDYLTAKAVSKRLLPNPGSQHVRVPKQVKLKANSSQWLKIKVTAPAKDFKGQKSTAIHLSAYSKQQGAVRNQYVYAIGLILNGQQKLTSGELKRVQVPSLKVRLIHKKPNISFRVVNPDPTYLMKTQIKVKLQNNHWSLYHYDLTKKQLKVAPNSEFYLNLPLGGKRLVPGQYTMTFVLKNQRYTRKIVKQVKITKHDAAFINAHNAEYQKIKQRIIIGLCVLVVIVAAGGWYYWRLKRKRR